MRDSGGYQGVKCTKSKLIVDYFQKTQLLPHWNSIVQITWCHVSTTQRRTISWLGDVTMARSAIGMTGPHNNLYISFHPHWLYFRTGGRPVGEIPLSASHSEPVFKTMWISSKTGSEFFTASSDGTVSTESTILHHVMSTISLNF